MLVKVDATLQERERCRGKYDLLDFCKKTKLAVCRLLGGEYTPPNELVPLDLNGWPKWLPNELYDLCVIRTRFDAIRALLTVLSIARSVLGDGTVDTSTIVDPFTGDETVGTIRDQEILTSLVRLGFKPRGNWTKTSDAFTSLKKFDTTWKKYHLSTRAGPNGHVMWNAISDLFALPESQCKDIGILGGPDLESRIDYIRGRPLPFESTDETFADIYNAVATPFEPRLATFSRRLQGLPQQDGKTRVVAIFDYWSQTCLSRLHKFVMNKLKRIPEDCTYDQRAAEQKIAGMKGKTFYSCDLSAATDRFPIDFQVRVLGMIIGKRRAEAWRRLLVDYPFTVGKSETEVKYSVGQPMGALSSWAVFSLCHHVTVRIAAIRCGRNARGRYCLLGDDIVIADDAIAREYMTLMKGFGVGISPTKSHVSQHFIEFTKRNWLHGKEITPFSYSGLKATGKSYAPLIVFLLQQSMNGWVPLDGERGVPSFERPFRSVVETFRHQSHGERLWKLASTFQKIHDARKRKAFDCSILEHLEKVFGLPISQTLKEVGVAQETFEERIVSSVKHRSLHETMENVNVIMYLDYQNVKAKCDAHDPPIDHSKLEDLIQVYCPISSYLSNYYNKKVVEFGMFVLEPKLHEAMWDDVMAGQDLNNLILVTSIFNMRSHQRKILAQSRLVKLVIDEARVQLNLLSGESGEAPGA